MNQYFLDSFANNRMKDTPRWMPIGQYRTSPLPILPLPPIKRMRYVLDLIKKNKEKKV